MAPNAKLKTGTGTATPESTNTNPFKRRKLHPNALYRPGDGDLLYGEAREVAVGHAFDAAAARLKQMTPEERAADQEKRARLLVKYTKMETPKKK